jgi:rhodanese-related sulfurtransferase
MNIPALRGDNENWRRGGTMKHFVMIVYLMIMTLQPCPTVIFAAESEFETFLSRFDYEVRDDMKIDSKELVPLITTGKAILVDVRFKEEVAAWRTGFALNIPMNELPSRIKELSKDKIIVAACPHKDRSAIAMAYLRSKGYNAKYLTDGLIGLAELLRGERARDFMDDMDKAKSKRQ